MLFQRLQEVNQKGSNKVIQLKSSSPQIPEIVKQCINHVVNLHSKREEKEKVEKKLRNGRNEKKIVRKISYETIN